MENEFKTEIDEKGGYLLSVVISLHYAKIQKELKYIWECPANCVNGIIFQTMFNTIIGFSRAAG